MAAEHGRRQQTLLFLLSRCNEIWGIDGNKKCEIEVPAATQSIGL
jgi:hypothetical protein